MDSIIHQFQLIGGGCLECCVENSEALSIFNRKKSSDQLVMSAMSAGLQLLYCAMLFPVSAPLPLLHSLFGMLPTHVQFF